MGARSFNSTTAAGLKPDQRDCVNVTRAPELHRLRQSVAMGGNAVISRDARAAAGMAGGEAARTTAALSVKHVIARHKAGL